MKEIGQVIQVKDDIATVKIERRSSCGSCNACGMGKGQNEISLNVPNRLNSKIGDWVELDLKPISVIKASFIAYIIPLIALILGVVVGYILAGQFAGNPDLYGAIGGILFTVISFGILKIMDPILNKKKGYFPKMVSIISLHRKGEEADGK